MIMQEIYPGIIFAMAELTVEKSREISFIVRLICPRTNAIARTIKEKVRSVA
jgi:hypothetical protein